MSLGAGRDHRLGTKAVRILAMLAHPAGSERRRALYGEVCAAYSQKAVIAKIEELTSRGYAEYGVSPRGAWLTDKGREALTEAWREDRAGNRLAASE